MDSWTTLEMFKEAFNGIDLSKYRAIRFYHEAGSTSIHINIFKAGSIEALCRDLQLESLWIREEQMGEPLGTLAGIPASGSTGSSAQRSTERSTGTSARRSAGRSTGDLTGISAGRNAGSLVETFADEMLVFCGITSDQLDAFLENYRRREISPILLKAVLTPTNVSWTPRRLYQELRKERKAFSGQ